MVFADNSFILNDCHHKRLAQLAHVQRRARTLDFHFGTDCLERMAKKGEGNLGFDLPDGRGFAVKEKVSVLGVDRGGTTLLRRLCGKPLLRKLGTNASHISQQRPSLGGSGFRSSSKSLERRWSPDPLDGLCPWPCRALGLVAARLRDAQELWPDRVGRETRGVRAFCTLGSGPHHLGWRVPLGARMAWQHGSDGP